VLVAEQLRELLALAPDACPLGVLAVFVIVFATAQPANLVVVRLVLKNGYHLEGVEDF
jgi:hypothetical protein